MLLAVEFKDHALRNMPAIIYCAVATLLTVAIPIYSSLSSGLNEQIYYKIAFFSLFLYIFPVALIAYWLQSRMGERGRPATSPDQGARLKVVFAIACLAIALAFLYVTITNGLFFRRIGFEALSRQSLAMPIYELFVHRSFIEISTTISCMLLITVLTGRQNNIANRFICAVCFIFVFLITFSFFIVNNRFQCGILIAMIMITFISTLSVQNTSVRLIASLIVFIGVLAGYSFKVTENIRQSIYIANCVDAGVLNPLATADSILTSAQSAQGACSGFRMMDSPEFDLSTLSETDAQTAVESSVDRPLAVRLNSVGLIAEITEPAERIGWGMGRFWVEPVMLYYYYFSDRPRYEALKLGLRTNPKVYIASYYLGHQIADTPSVVLTDLYANFGFFGFAVAGIAIGLLVGGASAVLNRATTLGPVLVGLFVLEKCLYIEKEFSTLIIDLFKFSPLIIMLAILLWRVPRAPKDVARAVWAPPRAA